MNKNPTEMDEAMSITIVAVGALVFISLVIGLIISRAVLNVLLAAYCCVGGLIVMGLAGAALYFVTWPALKQTTGEIKSYYEKSKRGQSDE